MLENIVLQDLINYLGEPTNNQGSEYKWRCPICNSLGGDTTGDNLCFNEKKQILKCFADDQHSKDVLSEINKEILGKNKNNLKQNIKRWNDYLLNSQDLLTKLEKTRGINKDTVKALNIGYRKDSKQFIFPAYDMNGSLFGGELRKFVGEKEIKKLTGTNSRLCLVNRGTDNLYILNEGFIDSSIMYQILSKSGENYSINLITPSNGVHTIPELIKKYDLTNIDLVVFLDNDNAGRNVSKQLESIINKPYIEIVLTCNCCKDMNDFYLNHPDDNIFNYIVDKNIDKKACYSLSECFDSLEKRIETGAYQGIKTGFKDLDNYAGGLVSGSIYVMAARPSMGKTSVALNIALKVAKQEKNVVIFSLETSKEMIAKRLLIIKEGKSFANNLESIDRIKKAKESIKKLPIVISDKPFVSLRDMESFILSEGLNPDLIIVDHLGLMNPDVKTHSEHERLSEICKNTRKFLQGVGNPALLLLSQLNRSVESRTNKRPNLSDLRESGTIEEIADIVMLLYRDEYYNPEIKSNKNIMEICIAKNRDGKTGLLKLFWYGDKYQIGNYDAFTNRVSNTYAEKGA